MNLRIKTRPGNPLVCHIFSYGLFYIFIYRIYIYSTFSIYYQLKINVCISSDVEDVLVRNKYLLHSSASIYGNYRSLQYHALYEQVLLSSMAHRV